MKKILFVVLSLIVGVFLFAQTKQGGLGTIDNPIPLDRPKGNNRPITPAPQQRETLTYYINGKSKTANVSYLGLQQAAYSLDQGGNIVQSSSAKYIGENSWTDWVNDGILFNRVQGIDTPWAVYGFLSVRFDFYSAVEQRKDGDTYISIYVKNNNDEFIWCDGKKVYVLQQFYVVNSGKSSDGVLGKIGNFLFGK